MEQRPLTLNEFIAAFATTFCVYKQDYDKWRVRIERENESDVLGPE